MKKMKIIEQKLQEGALDPKKDRYLVLHSLLRREKLI